MYNPMVYTPVFPGHGGLYVALGRAQTPKEPTQGIKNFPLRSARNSMVPGEGDVTVGRI